MQPTDPRMLDVDPADIPPTKGGGPTDTPYRVLPVGCLFAFGAGLVLLSLVVFITAAIRQEGPPPRDAQIGLGLAALTGVIWILAAWTLLRRAMTLTIILAALAVLIGAAATYFYQFG